MKSLTTILAVLAVATSFAVAQDAKPATGDAKPATGDTKPATGDTKPAEKKAATTAEAPKRDFGGRRALSSVRMTAAVVGTLSGTLTLLVIVARMVGTWKS